MNGFHKVNQGNEFKLITLWKPDTDIYVYYNFGQK